LFSLANFAIFAVKLFSCHRARYEALIRGDSSGPVDRLSRAGLWLGQVPYAAAMRLRNAAYDAGLFKSIRVPVPVVCIGNLSTGGTGKTPTVEWAAGILRADDRRPAILSRGYGVEHGPNDEAMMLEENLPDVPHLQGRDRVAIAMTAIQELESDVLILDDGFQHRRLARDLDLITIDAARPPHLDHLLPRGTLREQMSSLRRADALVLTRCDQTSAEAVAELRRRLGNLVPTLPIAETSHKPQELQGGETFESLEELRGRPVAIFSGIARPQAFELTVADLGAAIIGIRVFPDHHAYARADVENLSRWAEAMPAGVLVLTTQKDFVKLRIVELGGKPLRALRIGLEFRTGDAELRSLLTNLPRIEDA